MLKHFYKCFTLCLKHLHKCLPHVCLQRAVNVLSHRPHVGGTIDNNILCSISMEEPSGVNVDDLVERAKRDRQNNLQDDHFQEVSSTS